jgi:hypothetical protein
MNLGINAGAATAPAPLSPIDSQLNDLSLTVDRLDQLVSDLTKRLDPVLLPVPLVGESPKEPLSKAISRVEEAALRQGRRINSLNDQLAGLLERLQV